MTATLTRHPASGATEEQRSLFARLLPWLLVGYLLLDRGFAWLHIPATPAFVSEIVLLVGMVAALRGMVSRRLWRGSSSVALLALFMAWGMIRSVPGLFYDPEPTLRDGAIWIYALFAFAVAASLGRHVEELSRWLGGYRRLLPLMVVWLPLTAYLSEGIQGLTVPDSDVSVFSYKPGNAAVHLLMAVAFMWLVWRPDRVAALRWRYVLTAVAVLGILVVSTQGRGGFVAASVAGAALLVLVPERSNLMLAMAASFLVVAAAVVLIDPTIDVAGREVSADQFADNVASIVTGEGEGELGGNVQWRLEHWGRVWEGLNDDAPMVGHGFGPNLAEMYLIPQADIGLRNAHNSHLTTLARMGWLGGGIWLLLWGFWFGELEATRRRWRDRRLTTLSGLAAWLMVGVTAVLVNAVFDPTLEGPQVSIWLWVLAGVGIFLTTMGRLSPGRSRETGNDQAVRIDSMLEASVARR